MVKKLAAVVLAAAMLTTTAAFAAEVSGILTDSGIAIVTEDKDRLILNGYDKNGVLISSGMYLSESGTFTVPAELLAYRLRASFLDGEVYSVDITTGDIAEPAETAAPEETTKPKPTAKPGTEQKYPDVYDKQIDAIDAIAVVDKVSYGENENGDPYYYVTALYQGGETVLDVEAEVTVTSAPEEFSYMLGQNLSSLKKGDVICFTANLSGKIKGVGLVYRPLDKNIVTDGNDYGDSFEKLISDNGKIAERSDWAVMTYGGSNRTRSALAFGVVRDRNSSLITLFGADGKESNSLNVDLKKDTIVYVCDMSSKKTVSVGGINSLTKSSIPKSLTDDEGNVTYSDEYTMNYALLRVVDGTVTDAVIYTNYNK